MKNNIIYYICKVRHISVFCLVLFIIHTLQPLYGSVNFLTKGNIEMKCCQKFNKKSEQNQSNKEKKNCCNTNSCNVVVNCGCSVMNIAYIVEYYPIFRKNSPKVILYFDDAILNNFNSGYFHPPETLVNI